MPPVNRERSGTAIAIKVCLIGAQGSGKTAIAVRFARKRFNSVEASTIGAAFITTTLQLKGSWTGTTVKFDIWDTAGQERFENLTPMYYKGAQAVVIVYDITDEASFTRARQWIFEICRQVHQQSVVVALVGNKIDLADVCRVVSYQTGKALAQQYNLHFFETSAKTGISVDELFFTLAEETLQSTIAGAQTTTTSRGRSRHQQADVNHDYARRRRRGQEDASSRSTFSWRSVLCCWS